MILCYFIRNIYSSVLVAKLVKDFVVFYGTKMFVIQFNYFATSHPVLSRSTLLLSSHIWVGILNDMSSSEIVLKIIYTSLISFLHAAKPVIRQ